MYGSMKKKFKENWLYLSGGMKRKVPGKVVLEEEWLLVMDVFVCMDLRKERFQSLRRGVVIGDRCICIKVCR